VSPAQAATSSGSATNQGVGAGSSAAAAPAARPAAGLVEVLDRAKLAAVYDRLTTSQTREQSGLVNVNTASAEVLAALPGMDASTAAFLVAQRQHQPLDSVGDLLNYDQISNTCFEQAAPLLTTRSLALRLFATGVVGEGLTRLEARVEALVLVDLPAPTSSDSGGHEGPSGAPPSRTLRLGYRRVG
jgi:DNA uptake protein ComE-like DNA-binding protein